MRSAFVLSILSVAHGFGSSFDFGGRNNVKATLASKMNACLNANCPSEQVCGAVVVNGCEKAYAFNSCNTLVQVQNGRFLECGRCKISTENRFKAQCVTRQQNAAPPAQTSGYTPGYNPGYVTSPPAPPKKSFNAACSNTGKVCGFAGNGYYTFSNECIAQKQGAELCQNKGSCDYSNGRYVCPASSSA
jgi:hypothetical protein